MIAEYQSRMKRSIGTAGRPPGAAPARRGGEGEQGRHHRERGGKEHHEEVVKSSCVASSGLRNPPVTLASHTSTARVGAERGEGQRLAQGAVAEQQVVRGAVGHHRQVDGERLRPADAERQRPGGNADHGEAEDEEGEARVEERAGAGEEAVLVEGAGPLAGHLRRRRRKRRGWNLRDHGPPSAPQALAISGCRLRTYCSRGVERPVFSSKSGVPPA